ncbi:hypothetical protein B0H17DRAFT_1053255 [Mycena rosella]|uniref:Uncharacterized protein n=1 Tax=Mycena rosella TaxID=1033263 RepID=A0AAD7GIF3_MYCRO|nr:hypothetical protein B0H17DRAFT_1053255 [Mycena rosella]
MMVQDPVPYSPAPSQASSDLATPPPASTQKTRAKIHSGILQSSVKGAWTSLELRALHRQVARWKATQQSPQFHYVSSVAGARLDGIRHDLGAQIADVNSRLRRAEGKLVRFPELPSTIPDLDDVGAEMMRYTEELTAWLRCFAPLAVPARPRAPADSLAMDVDVEHPPRPPSLFAQVEALEEKLTDAEQAIQEPDLVSHQNITVCVDRALAAARAPRGDSDQSPGPAKLEATDPGPLADLQRAADELDRTLQVRAEQAALLLAQNERARARLAALEAQRAQRRRLKSAVRAPYPTAPPTL